LFLIIASQNFEKEAQKYEKYCSNVLGDAPFECPMSNKKCPMSKFARRDALFECPMSNKKCPMSKFARRDAPDKFSMSNLE